MSSVSSSYRVPYDLRPSKQVERRMIIDALQRLAAAGFPIADYQYTGFGAIYFVDFIMLHKLLGMTKLLSLERDASLEKRVNFNRPFSCVNIKMVSASSEIPSLSRDIQHFIWLDYDGVLHKEFLSDIQSAVTMLPPGSIILVTVDVEPPEEYDYQTVDRDFDGQEPLGPKHWKRYFEHHAAGYLPPALSEQDFGKSLLVHRTMDALKAAFKKSILARQDLEFMPMFNFVYKDTHRMLSLGGMITGRAEKRALAASTISEAPYYRPNFELEPCHITVPNLTRKERVHLDREMPGTSDWVPAEFDLGPDDTQRYREIYRFLPAFAEILL